MTKTGPKQERTDGDLAEATIFVRLFTALRIFTGLVWLTNGLAKMINKSGYDIGFFSFNLIARDAAKHILSYASAHTYIRPLGAFYQHVVLPHWGIWSIFLTLAELAVGIGLILGIASRLAAVGGLLLIGPVWIMLWHRNHYLWEYPAEDLLPWSCSRSRPPDGIAAWTTGSATGSADDGHSERCRIRGERGPCTRSTARI